ncbi:hypothetical protein AAH979_05050 [Plantactinospora sp. ZYX-F-223]|uniref:hypothetical protein n=1 Tax=Plantactinospora sp. ZYX-F-223 TaxID=3144103 RepID=UPI0031FC5170
MGQRITRAKRKIADAGIPYRIPADDELGERLAEVLAVVYLLFNEAYLPSAADPAQARWTATTCRTAPGPSCCATWAVRTRPAPPTSAPWH